MRSQYAATLPAYHLPTVPSVRTQRTIGLCIVSHYHALPLHQVLSVKLHVRHKRTKRDTSVCPIISVSDAHPMGGGSAMLHRNLGGGGIKNPGSTEIWSVGYQEND